MIRKYITEVENRFDSQTLPSEKTLHWIKWAKDKAAWVGQLVAKSDEILGGYNTFVKVKSG